MSEHAIPESLVENIRSGRAVLVVGSGVGAVTWPELLERMHQALIARGEVGDEAAAREVAGLLERGDLVRAVGYLGRSLGAPVCDRIMAEAWARAGELGDVARAIARLPFRHVWTTFPGDVIERAMEGGGPEGWPAPRVLTWRQAGELDRRKRTVLKVLGDVGSFVITPRSIRAMLARSGPLRDHIAGYYAEGSLVFVGFQPGDPDLAAMLDRVLGPLAPPESDRGHYLLGAGLGPVAIDELMSEHDIQAIRLDARSAGRERELLIDFLGELDAACAAAGIGLGRERPDDDDLDGWIARAQEDAFDDEVAARLDAIEDAARRNEDWERLVEVLMARIEVEGSAPGRADLLRQVADVYEARIGDLPRAFTALTAALREDPSDPDALDRAEKLAEDTGGWAELVGDVAQVAGEIEDREVASGYWTRLGHWYHRKLDHLDYALTAYRQAIKLDPARLDARRGLADLCRQQQRWSELADQLGHMVELDAGTSARIDLLLALGDLSENQLASTAKAIEAYRRAADVDPACEDALVALERLYRREERWSSLAEVLEARAALWEASGQSARAAATRRELATLRADKLGDLEGAIARHEAALTAAPRDLGALRALEELYAKVGRTADYLDTIERLCDAAPPGERLGLLRRLAMESEAREGGAEQAIRSYERVLEADPAAEDALSGLERLYRREGHWDVLADLLWRHAGILKPPGARAEKWAAAAEAAELLGDAPRAIEAHQNALAAQPERRASLAALAALYLRTEAPARALEVVVRRARLEGVGGAEHWVQAAAIAAEALSDPDAAEQYLDKALAAEPNHPGALVALARLHRARGRWAKAGARMVEAANATQSRLERIDLLLEAAAVFDEKLSDGRRALAVWQNVLELDPDHEGAGSRAVARLSADGRWQEALPIQEMLVRVTPLGDLAWRARREVELARTCAHLGMQQRAVAHFRAAATSDPGSVDAAIGLATSLHALATDLGGEDRWREAEGADRELLERHASSLPVAQAAASWHRLGASAAAMGELDRAEAGFRRALERDPVHAPSLAGLAELGARRGDWRLVVWARREMLEDASEDARVALLEGIGDLQREKLNDPAAALAAYQEGLQLRPGSYPLLHGVLDIYTETRQWRRAIETLDHLAAVEKDARRRAKYRFAAAMIARDEIVEPELAVEQLGLALEDDPSMERAFQALDPLLRERGEHRNLARVHRQLIKRLGDDAPASVLLPLWSGLGELCLEHLADPESAIAAFEVAVSLDPDGRGRRERLVELYLEAGEPRRQDAIDELQRLVQADPDRVELYRTLSGLYRQAGDLDRAFCLAQALVFLRAAGPDETALYAEHRPRSLVASRRRLSEDLWQRSILHAREDRRINAIFASLVGGIAATTAQPPAAFQLSARDRIDVHDESRPVARLVKHAATVLGIEPDPHLYVLPGTSEGLRVANTTDRGRLRPALLVGEGHVDRVDERELAFELGKRMAYLRPDRYVSYAMVSHAMLESALAAALTAAGVRSADPAAPEAARLAGQLMDAVPEPILAQVAAIARQASAGRGELTNGAMASWRTATDLTANRVGFILCNDLETAARRVAVEAAAVSSLPAKDRLRDLLAYSVSEPYFAVRRHLGVALDGRRSAA